MSPSSARITIEALVGESERPALRSAAAQLGECLTAAADGTVWEVGLTFSPPGGAVASSPAPNAVIASLLPEAARPDEPAAATEARWRAYLEDLRACGAPVFVCTVFRHVPDRGGAGEPSPLLERIRRLDRMAATLSRDLDVGVIDLDRAFAHIGGRTLQTDYRLTGKWAAEVAGHAVAWSLLSLGLDEVMDPGLQEQARTRLGGLKRLEAAIRKRLGRRAAAELVRG